MGKKSCELICESIASNNLIGQSLLTSSRSTIYTIDSHFYGLLYPLELKLIHLMYRLTQVCNLVTILALCAYIPYFGREASGNSAVAPSPSLTPQMALHFIGINHWIQLTRMKNTRSDPN